MTTPKPLGCEEALRRLAEYLDRDLSHDEQSQMQEHMDICRACFSRAEFERRLRDRLSDLGREAAPESVQSRVRKILDTY
jgi:anti-sigma factor (TIGR02949 family)